MARFKHVFCPHCGADLGNDKYRSTSQLRRYFAIIKAAFFHWPDRLQFSDVEELRKYLQVTAGYKEVSSVTDLGKMSKDMALLIAEAAIKATGNYALPEIHGDTLVVFKPKSISFKKMPHSEFCELSDKVEGLIRSEIGVDADKVLREFDAIV